MANPTSSSTIPSYPSSFPSGAMPPYALGIGGNQPPNFYPYAPIPNLSTYSSAASDPKRPVRPASGTAGLTQAFSGMAGPDCGKAAFQN
ncbi:hypothetical protein L873DRAFT_589564 [Choiromyces venosus 120613-1]|uniref:Uncharacterized protein n=1 Tax=Choiromyces venosus 120613-1 TaxID=1336337 RepID=A0A3N4IV14_9PEZI|nr:hypothetical protein L873DRAFT_589564 [Choiromyces venosus 120613-1]